MNQPYTHSLDQQPRQGAVTVTLIYEVLSQSKLNEIKLLIDSTLADEVEVVMEDIGEDVRSSSSKPQN